MSESEISDKKYAWFWEKVQNQRRENGTDCKSYSKL